MFNDEPADMNADHSRASYKNPELTSKTKIDLNKSGVIGDNNSNIHSGLNSKTDKCPAEVALRQEIDDFDGFANSSNEESIGNIDDDPADTDIL